MGQRTQFVGEEGLEPPRSKTADLQSAEPTNCSTLHSVAEDVGFEPTVPLGTTVFKTATIDHSVNLPKWGKHLQLPTPI